MTKRRLIILMMAVLMTVVWSNLNSGLAAQREGDSVGLKYVQVNHIHASLSIDNGIAKCYGKGQSRYTDTETVVKVTLQRRAIGTEKWSSICSWSGSELGRKVAEINEKKAINSGYDYRVYVSCTIRDSEGVIKETAGRYSLTISYPHS